MTSNNHSQEAQKLITKSALSLIEEGLKTKSNTSYKIGCCSYNIEIECKYFKWSTADTSYQRHSLDCFQTNKNGSKLLFWRTIITNKIKRGRNLNICGEDICDSILILKLAAALYSNWNPKSLLILVTFTKSRSVFYNK